MSESDELDEIRQRKLEELKASLEEGAGETVTAGSNVPSDPITIMNPGHLDQLVAEYDVVLVDFHADWCGPCQMLSPTIDQLAAESAAAVAKVDIDDQRQLAMQHQVRSVPTVLLFVDGDPVERLSGVREKGFYERLIAQHVN